ncbi:MAG: hypothetical protein HYZ92_04610 [Candidatus Omnitrophica bacterium]|nr:hypothetical protein [Candidatus Omnitrophota bacterium]
MSEPAPCQQKLHIRLAAEAVTPVRDVVLQEFQKEADIAGFRKGRAPKELVARRYPSQIREETVRRLTRQVFEQVTKERHLKPVGPFEVTQLAFDEATGLELEAKVEIEPEFSLADYRGVPLTKAAVAVSSEELERALSSLRESAAELVPAGEGQPKEKRLPNVDDEFAKDVGFENLEELRNHLDAKLREQKAATQHQELEQALCEALLARHQFEVPPGMVEKQAQRLTREFQARLLFSGRSEEQAKAELDKYTEQLRTNAARLVKLAFVLDRIAEKEGISITQDELLERLWKLAKRWGKDPAEVRRLLDERGLWASVLSSIRQDKTVAWLLREAQVKETTG